MAKNLILVYLLTALGASAFVFNVTGRYPDWVYSVRMIGIDQRTYADFAIVTPTADTWMAEGSGNNYGTATLMYCADNAGLLRRTLMYFDLSAYAGQTVQGDATLKIYESSASAWTKGDSISVYRINANNIGWTETGADWNTKNDSTAWNGGGGLGNPGDGYGSTALATGVVPSSSGLAVSLTISRDVIQSWIDARGSNAGVIIRLTTEDNSPTGNDTVYWSAKEAGGSVVPTLTFTAIDSTALSNAVAALKAEGVNTIMGAGAAQFITNGLPDGPGQWQRQVNYDVAIPFSRAVKAAGLKLFNHTTSTFVPIEALNHSVYSNWVSQNLSGGPSLLLTAYTNACFMDMNNPDFRGFLFAGMTEFADVCDVDGWMTDEVEWLADFYACGSKDGSWKKFESIYGSPYPALPVNFTNTLWRKYIAFRFDSGGDFYKGLLTELQKENSGMLLSGCLAGISKPSRRTWAMGSQNWLQGLNWGFFEMQEGYSSYGKSAGFLTTTFWPKYYREMALYNANGEANGWPCSYALGYPRRWQIENSEQFYIWAQSLTMGFRCWMRDYQAETDWFDWEEEFEQDLIKPKLIADVGVYFPEWSRDFNEDSSAAYENWSGVSEALAQEHVISDQLVRWHLEDPGRLSRFRAVVLPSSLFLTDTMAATLKAFVSGGGKLIVLGECAVEDPFGAATTNSIMPVLGISGSSGWISGSNTFSIATETNGVPAGTYIYKNGYQNVTALGSATVLASISGNPALIHNSYGAGEVFYFTGRLGASLYNNPNQGTVYTPTFNAASRVQFAGLVSNVLENLRVVEVNGLPSKVMVNAYDTDGDFDGTYKRTIHILDSYDGFNPGATIPNPATGNQPCSFLPFNQRGSSSIEICLRSINGVCGAKLISPDFSQPKALSATFSTNKNAYVIDIPAGDFGRYSVVIVDPE